MATAITTVAPANLCAGVQCQNFGAASTPAAGFTYTWSAANALVSAVGDSGQYCLVSFPYAGAASVTLTVGGGTICAAGSTYNVSVAPASLPALTVVYYNNQFVLQDNTQDTYQWGYDDVVTLDSSLIDSAIFQSYPDAVPDFLHKYYWVITTKDGCMQKTYFNGPRNTVGVQPLSAMASLTVAPNPAGDVIRINNNGIGSSKLVITDVTGKVLITCNDATANVEVNVSALSAGLYFVSSLSNDIIVGTVRFVKSR